MAPTDDLGAEKVGTTEKAERCEVRGTYSSILHAGGRLHT
jgi:hypothetical protein